MMPKTSAARAPTEINVPIGSSRGGCDSRVAGTIRIVPTRASAASTTLSAKIDGHESHWSSKPEMRRPRTAPPAATPTHVPTALPRSSGGKMVVITESVTGMMKAAATPITMRSPISCVGVWRKRARKDASPKSESPRARMGLRPIAVSDRTRRQQESGEGERVGIDDPLQLRLRGAGIPRDLGQGDVEAGDSRDDHRQREAHDAQHRAAAPRVTGKCDS